MAREDRKDIMNKKNSLFLSLLKLRVTPWFIFLLLISCQTAPKAPDISLEHNLPLEEGGYAYIIADKDALPILSQLMLKDMDNAQFQQIVDMTQFIAAAAYKTPNAYYRLAAWGNYPASRARMALNSSKDWKKQRSAVSGADYWYSANGYSIAISAGMALAATGALTDPYSAAPGAAIPEGFAAFSEEAILSLWLANPGAIINEKLGEMGIPLELPAQQVFVSLYPADDQRYTARLQLQLAGESQARALATMLVLVRNFIPLQTDVNNPATLLPSILFANPPEQDGGNLNITSAPLSVQEIALLLKMFSL